jgi:hypothetical protein
MEKFKNNPKQPIKLWLVEFTLTSGETTNFYVKAINQFEAYKTAEEYTFWLGNKTLESKLKTFRLMP